MNKMDVMTRLTTLKDNDLPAPSWGAVLRPSRRTINVLLRQSVAPIFEATRLGNLIGAGHAKGEKWGHALVGGCPVAENDEIPGAVLE